MSHKLRRGIYGGISGSISGDIFRIAIATAAGLLSDQLVGYLWPASEQRAPVVFGIFMMAVAIGMFPALLQEAPMLDSRARLRSIMPKHLHVQLVETLRDVPEFDTVDGRRGLLQLAAPHRDQVHETIYSHIVLEGSKQQFILNLLDTLLQDEWFDEGKRYLRALLVEIGAQSGQDVEAQIDSLLPAVDALSPPQHNVRVEGSRLWLRAREHVRIRRPLYAMAVPVLAIVVVLFSPLVSDVWARAAPTCPPDRTCILVADFGEPDDEIAGAITANVVQTVRNAVGEAGEQRLTVRRVAAVGSDAEAQAVAQEQKALLVIWGRVSTGIGQIYIDFELVDLLGAGDSADVRAYRIEPLAYDPINAEAQCTGCIYAELEENVAQHARIIAYTAVGLLHYTTGWPEQARFDFARALDCAGETVDPALLPESPPCRPGDSTTETSYGLLYYYLGRTLEFVGNYRAAIRYLEQARALNPQDPAVWSGQGLVYQRWLADDSAPLAREQFRRALTQTAQLGHNLPEPGGAASYYNEGLIHELLGEHHEAAADFREAIRRYQVASAQLGREDANPYVATVALGRVQRKGGVPEADDTLEAAVELVPEALSAYLELALLHHERPTAARNWLRRAQSQSIPTADFYVTQARLCTEWKEYECAERAYLSALEKRPGSGWLLDQVGTFYWYERNNQQQAADYFRRALSHRPCDPWMHERVAFAAGRLGHHQEAARHYARALSLLHGETAQEHVDRLTGALATARSHTDAAVDVDSQNWPNCDLFE